MPERHKVGVSPSLQFEGSFIGMCMSRSCRYSTDGWPTHEIAAERIRQHAQETEDGLDEQGGCVSPMETIEMFRERFGLEARTDGRAVLPAGIREV